VSTWEVIHGDCLEVLRGMPDASVDSTVCDPPYGLSFMGKRWDYDVPSVEVWAECLRVLKPGGHLLAFAGTRTQHRMAVRIEDAGFEIRDMIAWVYGSGFPKSKNVALSIDKAEGHPNRGRAIPTASTFQACDREQENKLTSNSVPPYQAKTDLARPWSGWGTALKPAWESVTLATKPHTPESELAIILSSLSRLEDDLCQLSSANVAVPTSGSSPSECGGALGIVPCSADEHTNTLVGSPDRMGTSSSVLAIHTCLNTVRSWKRTLAECLPRLSTFTTGTESKTTIDWKTLRFSLSQITPDSIIKAASHPDGLSASADTAVAHFNASLALLRATLTLSATDRAMSLGAANFQDVDVRPNLDPCIMARKPLVGTVAANVQEWGTGAINVDGCRVGTEGESFRAPQSDPSKRAGEVGADLGISRSSVEDFQAAQRASIERTATLGRWPANLIHDGSDEVVGVFPEPRWIPGDDNEPGHWHAPAARFFYCPKASRAERGGENNHPTVKPAALMAYLCRLVTPPRGVVLDPFTGSGSTGIGAIREGFNFVGIEREAEYVEIARRRIAAAADNLYAGAERPASDPKPPPEPAAMRRIPPPFAAHAEPCAPRATGTAQPAHATGYRSNSTSKANPARAFIEKGTP